MKISQLVKITGSYEDRREEVVATLTGEHPELRQLAERCNERSAKLQRDAAQLLRGVTDTYEYPTFAVRVSETCPPPPDPLADDIMYVLGISILKLARTCDGWRRETRETDIDGIEVSEDVYVNRAGEALSAEALSKRLSVPVESIDAVFRD